MDIQSDEEHKSGEENIIPQNEFWTVTFRVNDIPVYAPLQFLGVPEDNDGFSIGVFLPVVGTAVKILGMAYDKNMCQKKEWTKG